MATDPNNDFVSIVASSGGAEFTVGMMALTRFCASSARRAR